MATILYKEDSVSCVLNGHVFNDFITGDVIEMEPVNEATSHVDSANGVSISDRADKDVYNMTVRVQRNSPDDIFLNQAVTNFEKLDGSLKENFDSNGDGGLDNWNFESGAVTKRPTSTRNNIEVNAVHEYVVRFRYARRSI